MAKWTSYETLGVYGYEAVRKAYFNGESKFADCSLRSVRVQVLLRKSPKCPCCGYRILFFAAQRHKSQADAGVHLNAWTIKDDRVVMMTHDHIVPKSKGGTNTVENGQVMCASGNARKGSKLLEKEEDYKELPTGRRKKKEPTDSK